MSYLGMVESRMTGTMALDALVAALEAPDSDTREAAAIALGRHGYPRVSGALAKCLHDTEPGVRVCAAVALAKLGWSPTTNEEQSGFEQAFDELQAAATAGEDAVRPLFEELALAIGLEGSSRADLPEPPAVPGYGCAPADARPSTRIAITDPGENLFEKIPAYVPPARPPAQPLFEPPTESPSELADAPMVKTVAQTISWQPEADESAAITDLLQALEDPDPTSRIAAIEALNQEQGEEVTVAVLNCLSDPDPDVRLAAARSLENWGDPAHASHFLALLADENWELRMLAIRFVSRMNDSSQARTLCPLLADTNLHVRRAAAQAMGTARNPAAIEDLVVTLVDEEAVVRTAATTALEQINPYWAASAEAQRAQPRLQALLTDKRPRISAAAAQLLVHLRASAVTV
jgi:HEAT repeat protein